MKLEELNKRLTLEEFHILCMPLLNPELAESDYNFSVPEFHWDIYRFLQRSDRLQFLCAPVSFAKSTLLKIFAVYEVLVLRRERLILYVSSTDRKATDHLGGLEKLLNSDLLKVLYKYDIKVCNSHELVVEFHDTVGEEYKFESIASGSDIAGKNYQGVRPGLIIVDDMEDMSQARSMFQTDLLERWFFQILVPRLPSLGTGRVRMINTVLTNISISSRMLGKCKFVDSRAYEDWEKMFICALDENDRSIWEERHPTELLLRERELRPREFAANYMNDPVDEGSSLIKDDEVEYYDSYDIADFPVVYIHVDTTHTKKISSDYFCCVVMGESILDRRYYVLDYILEKVSVEEQARYVIQVYERYLNCSSVGRITFDEKANNAFGYWVVKLARESYGLSLPLEELRYGSDKFSHFESHVVHFRSRRVLLPSGHHRRHEAHGQLVTFPHGRYDDFVDGLSGCLDNFKQEIIDYSKIDFIGYLGKGIIPFGGI